MHKVSSRPSFSYVSESAAAELLIANGVRISRALAAVALMRRPTSPAKPAAAVRVTAAPAKRDTLPASYTNATRFVSTPCRSCFGSGTQVAHKHNGDRIIIACRCSRDGR